MRLARAADDALEDGRRVLVRCYHGYNLGPGRRAHADPVRAPRRRGDPLIRARRGPGPCTNRLFVEYLRAGLDTVRLLEELAE